MRLNILSQWHSLKTRMTLLTLGMFLIGIWSLSLYTSRMLRVDMQTLLGDQQFALVTVLAAEINEAMNDRVDALNLVAAEIDQTMLDNPDALQAVLDQRPLLQSLFSGGVLAHRPDGTAIAEVPRTVGRVGVNYMDVDCVAAALREGKNSVGRPVMGKQLGIPVFGIVVPIRDAGGQVIGALSSVNGLGESSFLSKIARQYYGKPGGYMLVARQHRQVVAATDSRLTLTALPAPGQNHLIDRFVEGYEGSGIATDSHGIEALQSAKGIPHADWYLAVAMPTREAFATIDTLQRHMLLAAVALTLLLGVVTWWMLKRQLSPLLDTVKVLAALRDDAQRPQFLPVPRQDEIGELIDSFNHLLATLAQREATLHESEERYRSFFQASPDGVFVHRNNVIIFANDAAARLLRYDSAAALVGRDWHELVMSEDWPVTEARVASLMSGESSKMPPIERRYLAQDGQTVLTESAGARVIFGGEPAVLSVIRDLTERRRQEQQRIEQERLQRNALVREVHHRIKNNLQSVAGLLQRELGKFMELDPRLETAISQVHAIAAVHGLQSADPEESVRLCDSIRNICKTIGELSSRPVSFSIENEQTTFRPTQIASDEAVSVALVLNELILNAIKHSPPDGFEPAVSLTADGTSAKIVIRNAAKNRRATDVAVDIDIDAGRGLGTGLRLVRSLLPDQGARLHHELDAAGFMLTTLELSPPVIGNFHGKPAGPSS